MLLCCRLTWTTYHVLQLGPRSDSYDEAFPTSEAEPCRSRPAKIVTMA